MVIIFPCLYCMIQDAQWWVVVWLEGLLEPQGVSVTQEDADPAGRDT